MRCMHGIHACLLTVSDLLYLNVAVNLQHSVVYLSVLPAPNDTPDTPVTMLDRLLLLPRV